MLIYTPNAPSVSTDNLITSSRVDLTITPPGSNGGSAITSYKIYINGSYTGSIGYTGTTATYQATGLSASTQYTFTVTAVNEIGEGSPSAGSITTTMNAPSVTATAVSSSQVNLTISPPTNNIQRNPITSYKIYINDVYKEPVTADSSYNATYQATDLTASTLYSFTVSAISIDGDGAKSVAATATTAAPAPILDNPSVSYYYNETTVPIPNNDRMDVLVVGGGGGGQEGYGPYVSNVIQPGGGGGSAGGITYISGITLTDGTITITPGSGGGGGNYGLIDYGDLRIVGTDGGASSVVYKSTTITAPGGIGATTNTGTPPPVNTNTGAQISFGSASFGGSSTGASGAGWSFVMPNVDTISYGGGVGGFSGSSGQAGNGSYGAGGGGGNGNVGVGRGGKYAGWGGNGGGGVIVIYYYNSVPNAATVANAPTISVSPDSSTQISVWITPPAYNGGSPIIKYNVYMNGVYRGETTTTVYYATGLTSGTTYNFKVSTVNGVGEGPQSANAFTTTYVVITL